MCVGGCSAAACSRTAGAVKTALFGCPVTTLDRGARSSNPTFRRRDASRTCRDGVGRRGGGDGRARRRLRREQSQARSRRAGQARATLEPAGRGARPVRRGPAPARAGTARHRARPIEQPLGEAGRSAYNRASAGSSAPVARLLPWQLLHAAGGARPERSSRSSAARRGDPSPRGTPLPEPLLSRGLTLGRRLATTVGE